jgi:polyisoprenoid-binding protein YceI
MRKPKAGVRSGRPAPGRRHRAYSGDSGDRSTIAPQIARHPAFYGMNRDCATVTRWLGVLCLSALLCGVEACAATSAQGWNIDEAQTSIGFTIGAVGFPTTNGHFAHYRGNLRIDFDRPAKSFTTFTVDAASVDVGSPSFNDFVKSSVLLNVERSPTMSFVSTQVEKLDARTARVTGNLTLLGVTKPITLTVDVATDPAAKSRVVAFVAKGKIQRSDFGMMFGIPLIDDALEITVKTRALTDE